MACMIAFTTVHERATSRLRGTLSMMTDVTIKVIGCT